MNNLKIQIIGAGLIGGSLSLALSRIGVAHQIQDVSPDAKSILESKGDTLSTLQSADIDLVVIAVPPDQVAFQILQAFEQYPNAYVTDLSSIKAPFESMIGSSGYATRYVGSHPMAGKEANGTKAADPNIFADRVWIICETEVNKRAVEILTKLIDRLHAITVLIPATEHDLVVSYLSHLPQIVSSSLADLAVSANINLDVAGPAFRDMTRIARSNPELWTQIASANRHNIVEAIEGIEQRLNLLKHSLNENDVHSIHSFFKTAAEKSALLPGKHGGVARNFQTLSLRVADEPGALAKVFNLAADINLNIEDISIEHVLNRPVAVITLQIDQSDILRAKQEYLAHGWEIRE